MRSTELDGVSSSTTWPQRRRKTFYGSSSAHSELFRVWKSFVTSRPKSARDSDLLPWQTMTRLLWPSKVWMDIHSETVYYKYPSKPTTANLRWLALREKESAERAEWLQLASQESENVLYMVDRWALGPCEIDCMYEHRTFWSHGPLGNTSNLEMKYTDDDTTNWWWW